MPKKAKLKQEWQQKLVVFLEKSGLEVALQDIVRVMNQRGVVPERRFSVKNPRLTFKIRRWSENVEHTFLLSVEIDKDDQFVVEINGREKFTEATLPTGPALQQLLVAAANNPIQKVMR